MTFSRPGFGSASIQPGNTLKSNPTISLPSNTDVRPNNQLRLDTSAPTTLANNELKRGKEIQNFLNFFTDDDKGLIKFGQDEIVRAADREVSAAVEQYGPDFLSSSNATEEMRDAYVSMSPRAKEKVIAQQGFNAAVSYGPMLQAAMADPAIQGALTKPGNDPETVEARSLAQSQAQEKALEAAGFPNSYQQLQFAKELGKSNGLISSEYYKKRMDRAAEASQNQLIQSGIKLGDKAFDKAEDEAGTGENTSTLAVISSLQETLSGAASYSPEVAAKIVATSVLGTIMEGTDDSAKYSRLTAYQKFLELSEITLPGGEENLADIPLDGQFGNMSLRQWLEGNEDKLKAAVDTDLLAKTKLQISEIYRAFPAADAFERAQDLIKTIPFQDPENLAAAEAFIFQRDGRVDSTVRKNDRAMKIRIDEEGLTPQLADEIENGRYSLEFKDEISKNRNNPAYTDPTTGRVMAAMKEDVLGDIVDAGFGDVADKTNGGTGYSSYASESAKEMMRKARKDNDGDPGIYEQRLAATYKQEVISRAVQRLEEDAAVQGDLTEREAVQQAIQEVNKERSKTSGGGGPVISPKDRMISYSQKTREEMRIALEGDNARLVITEDMVEPGKMRQWKNDNKGVDFNSLSENKKRDVVIKGMQRLEKINPETGEKERYTEEDAVGLFDELKKQAEQDAAPGQPGQRKQSLSPRNRVESAVGSAGQVELDITAVEPIIDMAGKVIKGGLEVAAPVIDALTGADDNIFGDRSSTDVQVREFVATGGSGAPKTAQAIIGGFLDFIVGAPPAYAGELENASPESLAAIRTSWQQGTQGLETPPLPQVAAATPTRYVPSAIATDKHETFVMIGVAEGTRTAGGGYTKAYYGHRDSGDGNNNRGTVSGGRGNRLSPRQVDQKWMRILTSRSQQATPVLRAAGLEPGTAGWNRVMFNVLDLSVQSPAAVPDFLAKLGQVRGQRFTVEAIAKARADSFFSPNSGRLDAPGFGNSYQRLFKDQRQRAGVFDFRRRL